MDRFTANPCGVNNFAPLDGITSLFLDAASTGSTKRSEGQICNFVELEKIREFLCVSHRTIAEVHITSAPAHTLS
jgi:hypothetical protein